MTGETPFRVALAFIIVPWMALGVTFRGRAAKAGGQVDRSAEGPVLLVARVVLGLSGLLSLLAYWLNPAWMDWASVPLPAWLRWVGAGFCVAGLPLLFWVLTSLGLNISDTVAPRPNATLVTSGPYRWVRHPFYTFHVLSLVGFPLVMANWFVAVLALSGGVMVYFRALKEEALLKERFGDAYVKYAQQAGRFFPRLRK
ncbi:MAG: methyltransferase family protein [bacterium]